jgi:hypothetical protein
MYDEPAEITCNVVIWSALGDWNICGYVEKLNVFNISGHFTGTALQKQSLQRTHAQLLCS